MGTVFLQLCLQFSLIMLLLTVVALLASGCLGEVVLPQGHVMAGRMPYNNPFRAGHPMGHIMGHPFHALPSQPYNMVPVATAVHDPTYISKNGEVEHVVKGIHASTLESMESPPASTASIHPF